jgi:hypothetical protein
MIEFKFYTNWMIPARFAATTYGPFIFIRPTKKDDFGLLMHERVHVDQFWRTCGLFGIAYFFSKKKKLQYEAEAYREQLKHYPDDRTEIFAWILATKYGLNISVDEARAALKG